VTDLTEYTPRPHRTLDEIEALAAFIEARVEPGRVAVEYGSEERTALEALLGLVHYTKGLAVAEVRRGDDPSVPFCGLSLVAWKWKDHPDWQPGWDPAA